METQADSIANPKGQEHRCGAASRSPASFFTALAIRANWKQALEQLHFGKGLLKLTHAFRKVSLKLGYTNTCPDARAKFV